MGVVLLEPFDRMARRAGYTCALCAGGPERAPNVPALYFAWLDERQKTPICARHAEGLRTASGATKFFCDDKELHNVGNVAAEPSITCPACGKTSYNRNDIERQYCGNCHVFIEDDVFIKDEFERAKAKVVAESDAIERKVAEASKSKRSNEN